MTKASKMIQETNRLIRGPSGFDYQVATNVIHDRIHQGTLFSSSVFDAALVTTGTIAMLIRPDPSISAHTRFGVAVGGDSIARLSKGVTFSAPGAVLTPENRNQISSNAPLLLLNQDPTITDPGTEMIPGGLFFPGGFGFFASGSQGEFFNEWILAPGVVYYAEVENISGVAAPVQLQVEFYEPIELLP